MRYISKWSLLAIAIICMPGCGAGTMKEAAQPGAGPVVVFGVDGLEWDVVLPLVREGRLPNFRRLMEEGCFGELETFIPTLSPVVWTTVATGKLPGEHGIGHFARQSPDGNVTLLDSTDRKTKAIWNIASDYDKRVSVIGWWMTYPVEEVRGVMVAQTNTRDQLDARAGKHVWKGTLLKSVPAQVFPPDRQNEMMETLERVDGQLPALTQKIFGTFRYPHSVLGQRLWDNCQWSFRADATYLEIALKLAGDKPPADLTLLYFGGPDVVGHRFWRYMQPNLFRHRPTPEEVLNFGRIIEDYYVYADEALGKLRQASGPRATILVLSDHGMKPANLNGQFDPDDPPAEVNSGDHPQAPPGVFLAAGPRIRRLETAKPISELTRQDIRALGSVMDITPTLLAMLRVPLGDDMEGRVLSQIFRDDIQIARQPAKIATHDTEDYFTRRHAQATPHPGDAERIRQLRGLGYID